MLLVFVCQTGGLNLEHYAFPDGSKVGSTVFEYLVIEGARQAYFALSNSAQEIHKGMLWDSFSYKRGGRGPKSDVLKELCSMVSTISLMNEHRIRLFLLNESIPIDFSEVLSAMSRESRFHPSHLFHNGKDGHQRLYYVNGLNVFLLFKIHRNQIVELELIEWNRSESSTILSVCELLVNFMLHHVWKSL